MHIHKFCSLYIAILAIACPINIQSSHNGGNNEIQDLNSAKKEIDRAIVNLPPLFIPLFIKVLQCGVTLKTEKKFYYIDLVPMEKWALEDTNFRLHTICETHLQHECYDNATLLCSRNFLLQWFKSKSNATSNPVVDTSIATILKYLEPLQYSSILGSIMHAQQSPEEHATIKCRGFLIPKDFYHPALNIQEYGRSIITALRARDPESLRRIVQSTCLPFINRLPAPNNQEQPRKPSIDDLD